MPAERFELPTLALQKPCTTTVLCWHDSPTWTRTRDIVINSHPFYQLNYWGLGWEVGFLYYQQETGITTVVNFTSLPETRLVSRFCFRSSTTCVSSPYPAICQKDYSVTPVSNPSIQQRYYGIKKEGCQHPS